MGVSVRVFNAGKLIFRHQVPTGQLVMVATRRITKKQYLSFSLFVQSFAKVKFHFNFASFLNDRPESC
jgi:hypothetical protein